MPRVKVDYVVSFSSEDPEHPASNLLAWEVGKKKWLCSKGEPSCSVVLQLAKAVMISSLQIGVHHAALVEVLVGRSETPTEPFQVLVPSCVFVSPSESRRDADVSRVRSFAAPQLAAGPREGRWDRLRLVCSQPYNKHCKYGLSFIHIFEPDATEPGRSALAPAPSVPNRLLALDTFSSDEDDFRPGELFAKHSQTPSRHTTPGTDAGTTQITVNTDAQIRQVTSKALRNTLDSTSRLVKTPIAKASGSGSNRCRGDSDHSKREKDSLMYTADDERAHARVDRVVKTHRDEQTKAKELRDNQTKTPAKRQGDSNDRVHSNDKQNGDDTTSDSKRDKDLKNNGTDNHKRKYESVNDKNKRDSSTDPKDKTHKSENKREKRTRSPEAYGREGSGGGSKRPHSQTNTRDKDDMPRAGPVRKSPEGLLAGVVLTLSGYENPRRGRVRDAALSMGARYRPDWGPDVTHIICAYPNTPKLRGARAAGSACTAVTADWVEQCWARRRTLPWQWFATEPKHKRPEPDTHSDSEPERDPGSQLKPTDDHSEQDTDDEIEEVLRKQKRRKTDPMEESTAGRQSGPDDCPRISPDRSTDSDVAFVRDERMQGSVTINDSDEELTDEESAAPPEEIDERKALPDMFGGLTFAVGADVQRGGYDVGLLRRYISAYGGLLLESEDTDSDLGADYVVELRGGQERDMQGRCRVRPEWVWRCHAAGKLLPA